HHLEFALIRAPFDPRYWLRIGINYHGQRVQHIRLDDNGVMVGWNAAGNSMGKGAMAKMRLAGYTIFPRTPGEQIMSDTKIGGGELYADHFVRVEFKARGWLGKTRNLAGRELEKDIELLQTGIADLLVLCLS